MSIARVPAPLVILGVGFTFSLAANLVWTWPGGPIRVAGGALASLALPAAVHLWPQIPAHTWPRRIVRALVMTLIALMAAYTTFSHASALLVAQGEVPLLAAFYPLMTELMVVMGVLAHRVPVAAPERVELAERKPAAAPAEAQAVEPAPEPAKPVRTEAQKKAAAERTARSRRHKAGDHTTCDPRRCADAPRVRVAS